MPVIRSWCERYKSTSASSRRRARELECDDDVVRFNERVRKLVKHKPAKDL